MPDVETLRVPLPPLSVQAGIVGLLDRETARIDSLIFSKRRMIELLNERMLSLASHLLIPAKALKARLGYFAQVQTGLTVDATRDQGDDAVERPYLRVANVQAGWLNLDDVKTVTVPVVLAGRATLQHGDVLMTEGGDLDKLGRGTVWEGQIPDCLHQNHVFAVRPRPGHLDPAYLALLTRTSHARSYFESTGVKTTNLASTSSSKILDFPIPVLPIHQQRDLVRICNNLARPLNGVKDALTLQIQLLAEHRQALITAAVTGGLESPGAAA